MSADAYCKVYLRGPASPAAMRSALVTAVGGRFEQRTLASRGMVISLIENTDGRGETDFIGWPWYLEIDAASAPPSAEPFIASIRSLLGGLRAQAVQAVPSCDFEDQLQDVPCP